MKNKIIHVAMGLMLALTISSCKGMSVDSMTGEVVQPTELPSDSASLTDVGNPEDEDVSMMKTYVNPEFEVKIDYDGSLDLDKTGNEIARFFSAKGEDIVATFSWLGPGETLDTFLADRGVDATLLINVTPTPFDKTVCMAPVDAGDKVQMECYHYHSYGEKGHFVTPVSGLISKETLGFKPYPFGLTTEQLKKMAEAAAKAPHGEIVTAEELEKQHQDELKKQQEEKEAEGTTTVPKPDLPPQGPIIVVPQP